MIPRSRVNGHFEYSAPGRSRQNLTIRMSYDEGHTWPVTKVLEPGVSGYSDLAVLPDGQMICLYENGGLGERSTQTAALTLATFNVEWLTDGRDHLGKLDKAFQQTYLK
jgi:sialidase-1